jgi:hypothetical protein
MTRWIVLVAFALLLGWGVAFGLYLSWKDRGP